MKRIRSCKDYIFCIRATSRVDLDMSVCLFIRIKAKISDTIKAQVCYSDVSRHNLSAAHMFEDFIKVVTGYILFINTTLLANN